ncbi:hypothetical protein ANANG_G00029000 [Anguilla anguilla]|uniref:Rho GDP-dissociation inhibitor 1 n=1 Tax=Anguilla anguilla TaxID=7936 RepID=A0A9D3S3U0_ANGAN|nr:hypothetical protein ANANG_G00029000 [Anguilla anguilla]
MWRTDFLAVCETFPRALIRASPPQSNVAASCTSPGSVSYGRLRSLNAILCPVEWSSRNADGASGKPTVKRQRPAQKMAEQEPTPEQLAAIAAENEEEEKVNYRPPAQKSLQEIQELDKNDESLRKYKEALLGAAPVAAGNAAVGQKEPRRPERGGDAPDPAVRDRPGPLVLDLTGDLDSFKKNPFVLKEGVEYRIKISFKVNKEIVSGLKYVQQTFRKGIRIDKSDYMVGSYGPRETEYDFLTTLEEAPKGMLARGTYTIKSKFTDDDKHDHLSWEWDLNIKKDWTD